MSIALATTWEDRLTDLGNVPAARVRSEPAPGAATVEDVVRLRNSERRLYELVDGTLVEKAMERCLANDASTFMPVSSCYGWSIIDREPSLYFERLKTPLYCPTDRFWTLATSYPAGKSTSANYSVVSITTHRRGRLSL